MRTEWVAKRKDDKIRTQMHYARVGIITEEMHYIAHREHIASEFVRSEVGRGRMIIPANIHHANLEPMCIGVGSKCKINSNIGNSAVLSNIEGELEKLQYSVKYGADTVMDLSTGGDIPAIRKAVDEGSELLAAEFLAFQVTEPLAGPRQGSPGGLQVHTEPRDRCSHRVVQHCWPP